MDETSEEQSDGKTVRKNTKRVWIPGVNLGKENSAPNYLIIWVYDDLSNSDEPSQVCCHAYADTIERAYSEYLKAFNSQVYSATECGIPNPESFWPMPRVYVINGAIREANEDEYNYLEPSDEHPGVYQPA